MNTCDDSQTSFCQVSETDAWSDDDGNAHYVLELERIHSLGSARREQIAFPQLSMHGSRHRWR
jgi:hypothetical protein